VQAKQQPTQKPQSVGTPEAHVQLPPLSGIAWNKDSADRLAIINGQPVGTAASISGYRVDEILQDRVKLSRNGSSFEIFIGRSGK
jgi:general secretion pathway protein B